MKFDWVSFGMWLTVFDHFLMDFIGMTYQDLPVPLKVYKVWSAHYSSNFVASVLANYVTEIGYAN